MILNAPCYRHHPIATLAALALALSSTVAELTDLIENRPRYYREKEIPKKRGGGTRLVYVISRPLAPIQRRIQKCILECVDLPSYLTGGVRGRSYVQSAAAHCSSRTLFGEDVRKFFPSIREHHVRDVFQRLLHFPPVVATFLAQLCTFDDRLPQGAHTSTHVSNLVLFDVEPAIAAQLQEMKLTYGRYIDDANVSSRGWITKQDRQRAIELIHSMLKRKGFKTNREKQVLSTRASKMTVHGLNVSTDHPTIPRGERRQIRAAVHEFETAINTEHDIEERKKALASVVGRVTRLKQFHPTEGQALISRLERAAEALK